MTEARFQLEVAPGITLRQFEDRDAAELFAAVDRNRARLREWLPWVDSATSVSDLSQFIWRTLAQYDAGRGPQCAIMCDGNIAGSVGCHPIDWPNRSCAIGYWVDECWLGKGLITRCTAALVDYLFTALNLHRVEIRCGAGNLRSCAVPKRLGFQCEGLLREAEWVNSNWIDLMVWGMLNRNWRPRSAAGSW